MISIFVQRVLFPVLGLTILFTVSVAQAAEFVQVVHGPDPAPLEKLAASELVDVLGRVFNDIEIQSGSAVAKRSGTVIFVGNPDTNPGIAREFSDWPKVTDQGIVIRSNGSSAHAVGGGSPAATLWAVYELGHRLGIRYLLRGDLDPLTKRPFDLSGTEVTIEPLVRERGWETLGTGAHTFESWGQADHQRLLKQLAKLKFNHLILKVEPWHPFVSYDFRGVSKSTAKLWLGREYSLSGDFVGKKAFGGARLFQNPDFTEAQTTSQMFAAGKRHLTAIIDAAHELGMTVSVQFRRTLFAHEFARVLNVATTTPNSRLSVSPKHPEKPERPARELFMADVESCFDTYPGVDKISWIRTYPKQLKFSLGEHRSPDISTAKKYAKYRRYDITASLSRESNETEILDLLRPIPLRLKPQMTIPAANENSRFSLAVHTPHLDMLPHTHLTDVERTLRAAINAGWSSLSIGPTMVTEFGQDVFFISRAMWNSGLKPSDAHKDLWATATGNESAAERLWLSRQQLEKASGLILAEHEAVPSLDSKDIRLDDDLKELGLPRPKPLKEVTDAYTQYMIELYRAHGAIDGDAKPYLFYYAKRGEYVLEYLGAVKAVREAALAKKAGDTEAALEHLEQALELTYNCINTLSDIARDQGDRGLIAELNAYAYRPLIAELERLSEED